MAFYLTLDTRFCSLWNQKAALFASRLSTPLHLSEGGWHVALLDYSVDSDLLLHLENSPVYIQTDIVEPQLVCLGEDRILYAGPFQKHYQAVSPRFRKVAVPQIDTVTIQLHNSKWEPFQMIGANLLINLMFQCL